VALAFQDLIIQLGDKPKKIRPSKLKSVINEYMPDFSNYGQHDAFEFLLQFFDVLHEDLKSAEEDKSIVSELFQSEIIADRKFKCGFLDPSDDQPSYLILPLPSGRAPITLESCVAEWTRIEAPDEANPLWCSRCRCLEAFEMQVRVDKLAEYAVVQFLRFKHGRGGTTKDDRAIDYPLEFDSEELLRPAHPTGTYVLVSVICHSGNVHGGHYVCYVRRSPVSQWYHISDSSVSEANSDSWKQRDAYILFYQRQTKVNELDKT
jgi:ubiquitin C-terminal hydrolase